MECVTSVMYSILINGKPTPIFSATKVLSPYLFAICMEYLFRSLKQLRVDKGFGFHLRYKKTGITHLAFADDLLFFCKGERGSIGKLMKTFKGFSKTLSLQANSKKIAIYYAWVNYNV